MNDDDQNRPEDALSVHVPLERILGIPDQPEASAALLAGVVARTEGRAGQRVMGAIWESTLDALTTDDDGLTPIERLTADQPWKD